MSGTICFSKLMSQLMSNLVPELHLITRRKLLDVRYERFEEVQVLVIFLSLH